MADSKKEHHHSEAVSAADLDHHGDIEGEEGEVLSLSTGRKETEMDMTPMVDVTFLLLIFFMVTASFQLQKSIEMPRQQTDAPSTQAIEEDPEELDQVELQIDEFGAERKVHGAVRSMSRRRRQRRADAS